MYRFNFLMNTTALLLLGGALLLGLKSTSTQDAGLTMTTMTNGKLSPQQVYAAAQAQIAQYGFNVSPEMATAICIIESGDITFPENGCDPGAARFESGINDTSTGLMQVLSSTAQWLAGLGYSAYGTPTPVDLFDAQEGLYFGLSYLDWLSKWNGADRDESFIVQSYNAGPGHSSSAYLEKYQRALAWLQQNGM